MLVTRQYTDAEVADRLDEVGAHLDLDEYDIARGVLAEAAKRLRSGASFQAGRKQMAEEAAAVCDGLRDDKKEADALELFQLAQTSGRSESAQLSAGEFWSTVGAFNGGLRRAARAIRSLATPTEGKT